jgi:hypothetical protein
VEDDEHHDLEQDDADERDDPRLPAVATAPAAPLFLLRE